MSACLRAVVSVIGACLPASSCVWGVLRHLRLRLAGVDAVSVHMPAAAGREWIGMGSARAAVRFWQRIRVAQLPDLGRGGVRERHAYAWPSGVIGLLNSLSVIWSWVLPARSSVSPGCKQVIIAGVWQSAAARPPA